jgi:hypothetical protein
MTEVHFGNSTLSQKGTEGEDHNDRNSNGFRADIGRYPAPAGATDIFITKHGKTVAKLSAPDLNAVDLLGGLLSWRHVVDPDSCSLRDLRLEKNEKNV